ncbi:MAG TPA: chemotaxis protein CheW [Planctomycetes bacterium]|nr:chemotaxis protein CheW [Planctomycetota bacterium]
MSDFAPARSRTRRNATDTYLTFALGEETFALSILRIREIIGIIGITPMPGMPPHVRGVLDLRGKVIPVVDLRCRLGFTPVPDRKRTCIVIVQVGNLADAILVGLVVDRVCDVRDIPPSAIEAPPHFGQVADASCITGVGKCGKQVVMLLDTERVSGREEFALPTAAKD